MQESTSNQPSHSTGQGTSQDLPFSNFSPWSDLLADEQLWRVLFTNVNVDSTSDSKSIPEHEPQSSMPALSPSSTCIGSSPASGEAGLGENTTLPVIETTQEDVKRNRRRALNREYARQSRQRKRNQIAGRQIELSDLVAENQRLYVFFNKESNNQSRRSVILSILANDPNFTLE
jgi:hypothetical protein